MKKYYKEGNKNLENPNILIDQENKIIEIQPYNTELCLKSIPPLLEIIRLEFPDDYAVDLSCDHNFDGLRETNVALLKAGGSLFCNYTGKSTNIKKLILPVDFNAVAKHIMFSGSLTEYQLIQQFNLAYRSNKTIADIKNSIDKAQKNGHGKTENELGFLEIYLAQIFKKNQNL